MNFALILFTLLVITCVLWVADHFFLRKRRAPGTPNPWWVEYGASFFPVILIVFLLRSFVVEPFKIPSGSMIPTLEVGDFILVNKWTYGIRLPIINRKIIDINDPERGDVMVFRYPVDTSMDYIKRVVGVAGDEVTYRNKRLIINGEPVQLREQGEHLHAQRMYHSPKYEERLGDGVYSVLLEPDAPAYVSQVMNFPHRENCSYTASGFSCTVPDGHYFVMGDNRDASSDSRVWGFVPDENIVGKAFFIWLNFSDMSRIGGFE